MTLAALSGATGVTLGTTTVNSSTQITQAITISGTATTGGQWNFSVTNSSPGGGTSATQTFTVSKATPTIGTPTSTVNPSSTGQSTTLAATVSGGASPTGTVTFYDGGVAIGSPANLSSGSASISYAFTTAGSHTITAQYNGDSNNNQSTVSSPLTQTVDATPNLSSISPTSVTAGAGNTLLTATDTTSSFISGDTIYFNGSALTTTFVNSSTLTATITASGLTAGGTVNVLVKNPIGGSSSAQVFTINNPAPTLTGISPTGGSKGQSPSVILTGTGFISGVSTVRWPR